MRTMTLTPNLNNRINTKIYKPKSNSDSKTYSKPNVNPNSISNPNSNSYFWMKAVLFSRAWNCSVNIGTRYNVLVGPCIGAIEEKKRVWLCTGNG